MKRISMIIVLLIQVALIAADHHTSSGDRRLDMNKRLYHTLDSLISQYDQLTAEKERRVAAIKDGVNQAIRSVLQPVPSAWLTSSQ